MTIIVTISYPFLAPSGNQNQANMINEELKREMCRRYRVPLYMDKSGDHSGNNARCHRLQRAANMSIRDQSESASSLLPELYSGTTISSGEGHRGQLGLFLPFAIFHNGPFSSPFACGPAAPCETFYARRRLCFMRARKREYAPRLAYAQGSRSFHDERQFNKDGHCMC